MTARTEVARDTALAAADLQRPSTRGRDELEECVPEAPVPVVPRRARPGDEFLRIRLPADGHGFNARTWRNRGIRRWRAMLGASATNSGGGAGPRHAPIQKPAPPSGRP